MRPFDLEAAVIDSIHCRLQCYLTKMLSEHAFFKQEVLLCKAFQPHAVAASEKDLGLKCTDWQCE